MCYFCELDAEVGANKEAVFSDCKILSVPAANISDNRACGQRMDECLDHGPWFVPCLREVLCNLAVDAVHVFLLKSMHFFVFYRLLLPDYFGKTKSNSMKSAIQRAVRIVEVGPRDGLQNEKTFVCTATKIDLITRLAKTGLEAIEATSFVAPKWVPQMADAQQVYAAIRPLRTSKLSFPVLIPNTNGLEKALDAGITGGEIAVFVAASETFSKTNINCSVAESIIRTAQIVKLAKQNNIRVRAYISTVVACPYEGWIHPIKTRILAEQLLEMGCYEISLGDTIGKATPNQFKTLLKEVAQSVDLEKIAVHCHDTYGQALANILVSLDEGVRVVDSSIAGLGGCPYAKGATGNVATEDVVYLLNGLGLKTGVDLEQLVRIGHSISKTLGREYASRSGAAIYAALDKK